MVIVRVETKEWSRLGKESPPVSYCSKKIVRPFCSVFGFFYFFRIKKTKKQKVTNGDRQTGVVARKQQKREKKKGYRVKK